ncbi:hypothetical protein GQ42DRAFT_8374 [Ramicandelaber brevisporus]|nr:hypothetical protein GQ42DRAFT_8374 [Ramicandelaber brevisporus]
MQGPRPKKSTLFPVELFSLLAPHASTHFLQQPFMTTTMSDEPYFRLFDLPGELVQHISFLFFNTDEARELLTVSRAYHDLFARRVWWKLDSRIFTLSEPTRSLAIARYGKLVRYISFDEGICSAIKPDIRRGVSVYDILFVFSGVTALWISADHNSLVSNGIQFTGIILCFPKLYKLDISMHNDYEPYDLVTLALAINHRHNNRTMNRIEYLKIGYFIGYIDNPWTRLSIFVRTVKYIHMMKVKIYPLSTTTTLPSQSELHVLSKYFIQNPNMDKSEDTQFCYATLNRSWFWKPLDMLNSYTYPQLRRLYLRTCCMSLDTYDYSDITPSNFPRLQSTNVYEHECKNMASNSHPPAWKKVLLQNWLYLNRLDLSVNLTCEQLVAILEYNFRLTILHLYLHPKMLDENKIFNLATIVPVLLRVQQLSIIGKNEMKLDYSPDYDDYYILTRSQINVTQFSGLALSSRIFKLLYFLPRLVTISVRRCKFYSTCVTEVADTDTLNSDPNEIDTVDDSDRDNRAGADDNTYEDILTVLNTISAKYSFNNPCNIKDFNLEINRHNYDWPLDVTLEMIALMTELRTFILSGESEETLNAVKARFPHIKFSYDY